MNTKLHLAVIGSPRYFSRSLGDTGRGYHLKEQSDCRCYAESGAVLDAAFDKIAADSEIDAVIITGFLANDNELCSHKEIREKLYSLQKKKPVFVFPSDKYDKKAAARYLGNHAFNDVAVLNKKEIPEFYKDFGFSSAVSALNDSYCAEIAKGYKLLCLNNFNKEETNWAENILKEADKNNESVIILESSLLLPHVSALTDKNSVKVNGEETAEILADSGAKLLFGGIAPNQHIAEYTSEKGNSLYEINLGALPCYPAPIVHCIIDENEISISTEELDSFKFDGETIEAQPFLKQHLTETLSRVYIPGSHSDALEFLDRINALGFKLKRKRFYFPVLPIVYAFSKLKAGSAAAILNTFSFGKAVNRKAVKAIKAKPLTDITLNLLVNVFDSRSPVSADSDVYRAVADLASVPRRIAEKIACDDTVKTLKRIESLVKDSAVQGKNNRILNIKRK